MTKETKKIVMVVSIVAIIAIIMSKKTLVTPVHNLPGDITPQTPVLEESPGKH